MFDQRNRQDDDESDKPQGEHYPKSEVFCFAALSWKAYAPRSTATVLPDAPRKGRSHLQLLLLSAKEHTQLPAGIKGKEKGQKHSSDATSAS